MIGLDTPIHRIPVRDYPITPAPALMPQHHPMTTSTEPEELNKAALAVLAAGAPSPGAAAAADQGVSPEPTPTPISVRQHLRGDRITITVPDEILAVAQLTSRAPAEIVADLLACQVSAIRSKASRLLGEVVL